MNLSLAINLGYILRDLFTGIIAEFKLRYFEDTDRLTKAVNSSFFVCSFLLYGMVRYTKTKIYLYCMSNQCSGSASF
jgi:hypothetical protein